MAPAEHFWQRALWATGPLWLWAAHFLASYVLIAVACRTVDDALGVAAAPSGLRTWLVATTLLALAVQLLWLLASLRRRSQGGPGQLAPFLAIGCAALASVALLWALAAVLAMPLCRPL